MLSSFISLRSLNVFVLETILSVINDIKNLVKLQGIFQNKHILHYVFGEKVGGSGIFDNYKCFC